MGKDESKKGNRMSLDQMKAQALTILEGLGGRAKAAQVQGALDCSNDDLMALIEALEALLCP